MSSCFYKRRHAAYRIRKEGRRTCLDTGSRRWSPRCCHRAGPTPRTSPPCYWKTYVFTCKTIAKSWDFRDWVLSSNFRAFHLVFKCLKKNCDLKFVYSQLYNFRKFSLREKELSSHKNFTQSHHQGYRRKKLILSYLQVLLWSMELYRTLHRTY